MKKIIISLIIYLFLSVNSFANNALAQVVSEPTSNIHDAITLTFDDANSSQYINIFQILQSYNQKGVFFTSTGLAGTPGYLTWIQLNSMQSLGAEIACHTVTHAELPTLANSAMKKEVVNCAKDLIKNTIKSNNFATPYGAYDWNSLAQIARYFNSHRGFHEVGANKWPYNKYYLHVQQITNTTTLETVKKWIDSAVANKHWLIIVFHEIFPTVDPTDSYSWSGANFTALLDYLSQKNITTKTIQEVLNAQTLVSYTSFESGFDNWTTNSPRNIKIDTKNNGSYPSPKNSVYIKASNRNMHLFGPKVAVRYLTTYGTRFFVNTNNLTSGELGFYIDEYDSEGNWISGKWLGMATNNFVIDESHQYTPSSVFVSHVALQVYITAGVGSAYIDSIEFFTP